MVKKKGEDYLNTEELKKKFISMEKPKKGGQKIVYPAIATDGKKVALKLISNAADARTLQEIDILKGMSIPNVPRILESGIVRDESIDEDVLYIVESFIDGVSLRDWINQGHTATLSDAFKLLDTLLQIEIELEKNGILHRDINPNNIILGKNGVIYLIDFGIAKILGGVSLTLTAAAHGPFTPGYAPHEQMTNNKMTQDVRTDLFQIGVTVYEYCTGNNPFIKPHDALANIITRTMTYMPPQLSFAGDTKGMFAQFIHMLMAKNQSQRPDSANAAFRYLAIIRPTLLLED